MPPSVRAARRRVVGRAEQAVGAERMNLRQRLIRSDERAPLGRACAAQPSSSGRGPAAAREAPPGVLTRARRSAALISTAVSSSAWAACSIASACSRIVAALCSSRSKIPSMGRSVAEHLALEPPLALERRRSAPSGASAGRAAGAGSPRSSPTAIRAGDRGLRRLPSPDDVTSRRSTIDEEGHVGARPRSPAGRRRARGGGGPRADARRARRRGGRRWRPPGSRSWSAARASAWRSRSSPGLVAGAVGAGYLWVVVHKALGRAPRARAQRRRGARRARRRGRARRPAGPGLPRRRAVAGAAVELRRGRRARARRPDRGRARRRPHAHRPPRRGLGGLLMSEMLFALVIVRRC